MKSATLLVGTLALCIGGTALAQEKKPETRPAGQPAGQPTGKPAEKAPAGQPSEEEMMKAWMEANKIGENHKILQKSVGTWSATVKSWHVPGAPPDESTGTATVTSELDGRFTKVDFKGSMGGTPFSGLGHYGYNNATKKFESTWMDSMSTGIMMSTGTYDASKKAINWSGTSVDPMDGQTKTFRSVETYNDDNTMTFEMFGPGPDGKEYRMMEIKYVRTGGVKPAATTRPLPAEKATPAKK